jgi:hypothetical protein
VSLIEIAFNLLILREVCLCQMLQCQWQIAPCGFPGKQERGNATRPYGQLAQERRKSVGGKLIQRPSQSEIEMRFM